MRMIVILREYLWLLCTHAHAPGGGSSRTDVENRARNKDLSEITTKESFDEANACTNDDEAK